MPRSPAPKTRIQKSGNGHRYFLDGQPVKGVTTILGDGIPKPALMNWAAGQTASFVVNRLGVHRDRDGTTMIVADDLVRDAKEWNSTRKYAERYNEAEPLDRLALEKILKDIRYRDLQQAGARGTEVHRLGELLADGEEVEVPEEYAGHVESYIQFLDDWAPVNASIERVMVNRRWRYMGRSDLIAEFPDRVWADGPRKGEPLGRGLLDIKTSRSGIFGEVALQLEAYAHAETMLIDAAGTEVEVPPIDFIAAIHVRADGYDVYSFYRGENNDGEETFRVFLYAKQIAEWLNRDTGAGATIRSDAHRPPITTTTGEEPNDG